MKKAVIAVILAAVMLTAGCSTSWVTEAQSIISLLAPAAINALEIAALSGGPAVQKPTIDKINSDTQNVSNLLGAYKAASDSAKPDALSQLYAGTGALQANLTTVFATAQISNPASQAKFSQLTGLVLGEIASLQALIPVVKPASSPVRATAKVALRIASANNAGKPVPAPMTSKEFKRAYNKAAGKKVLP